MVPAEEGLGRFAGGAWSPNAATGRIKLAGRSIEALGESQEPEAPGH